YFYLRLLARAHRYQVVTGKGYRPRDLDLGVFRWLAIAFVVLYLLLAVALPFLVLLWASLLPVLQMPSAGVLGKLTLANYNGLLLVISVALLTAFFSFMISWVVVRTRTRYRYLMDVLAMRPHAIPGLAFAFALAMLGILAVKWAPWLPVTGTLGVIVVAHLVHRLPFGTRVTNTALAQVHPELEESAALSGAAQVTVMRRILAPLVRPSLVYLALWTALLSLQEVSMALFLSGPQNQ